MLTPWIIEMEGSYYLEDGTQRSEPKLTTESIQPYIESLISALDVAYKVREELKNQ